MVFPKAVLYVPLVFPIAVFWLPLVFPTAILLSPVVYIKTPATTKIFSLKPIAVFL